MDIRSEFSKAHLASLLEVWGGTFLLIYVFVCAIRGSDGAKNDFGPANHPCREELILVEAWSHC
jgi:hypothetical protein